MSTRSQLTKDLNESVKNLLGKQVKILFKNVVRLETKADKTENRVLVFSPCRILLLTAKVPTRIDCHFHYLEIVSIESKRGNSLCLKTSNDKTYSFVVGDNSTCADEVDLMISSIAQALENVFPEVPLRYIVRNIDLIPTSRLKKIEESNLTLQIPKGKKKISNAENDDTENADSFFSRVPRKTTPPCGNFSRQYFFLCDFHNAIFREEVSWDVENIYVSKKNRNFSLKDFDHLDQKDQIPVIGALEFDTWFESIETSTRKKNFFPHDKNAPNFQNCAPNSTGNNSQNFERALLKVLKKNFVLEELNLENSNLKIDFLAKFSEASEANFSNNFRSLNFSRNFFSDCEKAGNFLGNSLKNFRHKSGIRKIDISYCNLFSKSINSIFAQISNNNVNNGAKKISESLTFLNLSGNVFKDDVSVFLQFLSQPNALKHLDLSATDLILENVFGALSKGCTTNLVHLNVSKNPFSKEKKSKESPISFKQFFTSALNLKHLNFSYCKLPQEALKNLLLGLACNEYTDNMHLDLSSNQLGAAGAHVLESCIHGVRCLSSLDISDNSSMDVDLSAVLTSISKNKSLKHLNISRNTQNVKTKHVAQITEILVRIIQAENCLLETLVLSDWKLKQSDSANILNSLCDNKSLKKIDLSGNNIGDVGAKLLSKVLQINESLLTVIYDRNGLGVQGYVDLNYALKSNRHLREMPYPIHDIVPLMKNHATAIENLLQEMQQSLMRNLTLLKVSDDDRDHEKVDNVLVEKNKNKLQGLARLVNKMQEQNTVCENEVVSEANRCRRLIDKLLKCVDDKNSSVGDSFDRLFDERIVDVLDRFIGETFEESNETMTKICVDSCPNALGGLRSFDDDRRNLTKTKRRIMSDFVDKTIRRRLKDELGRKMRELTSSLAFEMSEKTIDEVRESLARRRRASTSSSSIDVDAATPTPADGTRRRQTKIDERSSSLFATSSSDDFDDLSSSRRNDEDDDEEEDEDFSTMTEDSERRSDRNSSSPMATPHLSIKRKSLNGCSVGRKLRPKSVMIENDATTTTFSSTITNEVETNEKARRSSDDEDEDENDDKTQSKNADLCLPSSSHRLLKHLVKSRPRRTKTRQSTTSAAAKQREREKRSSANFVTEEGLESFFRAGSVTPTNIDRNNDKNGVDGDVEDEKFGVFRSRSIDDFKRNEAKKIDFVVVTSIEKKTAAEDDDYDRGGNGGVREEIGNGEENETFVDEDKTE